MDQYIQTNSIKPDSLIGKEVTITINAKTKKYFQDCIGRFAA